MIQKTKMRLSTREEMPENAQELGLVKGVCILAVNLVRDMYANFRNLKGGNVKEYNVIMDQSLDYAINDMIQNAEKMQADGVCAIKIYTPSLMQGAAETVVVGTAYKIN